MNSKKNIILSIIESLEKQLLTAKDDKEKSELNAKIDAAKWALKNI